MLICEADKRSVAVTGFSILVYQIPRHLKKRKIQIFSLTLKKALRKSFFTQHIINIWNQPWVFLTGLN